MKETHRELAVEWFDKAQEDELSICAIFKERGAPSTACFLSQQMAEKYLKKFLTFRKKPVPKTHDLIFLWGQCKKIEKKFSALQDMVKELNKYYIITRYPADYPEGFSPQEAKEAFGNAKELKNFVLRFI